MSTRASFVLLASVLIATWPGAALAQGTPGDDQSPIKTTVSVVGSPQGDRYVVRVAVSTLSPGMPGTPSVPAEEPPPTPPPPPRDAPPVASRLPRTTYYTRSIEGDTAYCLRREEEKGSEDLWAYWYELCLVDGVTNESGDRLHLLTTNVPVQISFTPGPEGRPWMHVVPYVGSVYIPQRYDVSDVDIVGTPSVSATDETTAAAQVLASLPMPQIELRVNPDLGLVNVPGWFWVAGYDGRPFGRTESVFLSGGTAPVGDCPPLLPVESMRTRTSYPPGGYDVMRAVLGGRLPPILWGWGYSDVAFHTAYLGYDNFHTGLDVLLPEGTPLRAPAAGVVTKYTDIVGARVARLTLPSGHTYNLAHLRDWGRVGPVRAGDIIGYSGDTGYSGDPHLHLEMTPPDVTWGEWVAPEHWTCLGGPPGTDVTVSVTVRATSYTWDFGDGTVTAGTLGYAYPRESDVRHTYRRSSAERPDGFPTRLTVGYRGLYTINNGPPQPLPPLTRTYEGRYEVQEAQSVLTGR